MKPLLFPALFLALIAPAVRAQNTPPAPVPSGAGAVGGGTATEPPPAESQAPDDPADPQQLKQYGLDRYDRIIEKSPFNFKIVKQEAGPQVSFATDLALAGVTRDVGKGIEYATIVDKKKNTRFVINNQRPNDEGIQLVRLNRADTLLSTTVLARKGNEEKEIKAEKQIIERKAVVAANVRAGVQGGQGQGAGPGPGGPPNQGGPGPGNRGMNRVQGEINAQLQPPTPGQGQGQGQAQAGQQGGGATVAVQPQQGGTTIAANQQPAPVAAPTVADQQLQQQNRGGGRGPRGQGGPQSTPTKRRVILPPPVVNQ
jgi:hypothetical protein